MYVHQRFQRLQTQQRRWYFHLPQYRPVGIEEGENIIFSVESVAAESVGAHTLVGNGQGALAASTEAAANPSTIADDIEIFGFLGTKETASSVGDTAKETAVKINNLTGETGLSS